MNVFENLIEELRDENLLEDTVIDLPRADAKVAGNGLAPSLDFEFGAEKPEAEARSAEELHDAGSDLSAGGEEVERDFYRKRAMDEISSLQMVEHVLSGIEREHMKIVPASYDDLQAKKALHNFLQVQVDSTTTEYADAEFHLMRETESWSSALSARDRKISVANLRRFCENSRPGLSSQALIAIARFYRNAAFSEMTRAKFDFVMTRLFSRETEAGKRRVLFGRVEMIGHIRTLYANWASVALYSDEDIAVKARSIVAGIEHRVTEIESALSFDQLIQDDFFKKVHEFKETTGEMFFAPEIVAATIECNTQIGNRFVDLIRLERERTNPDSVEQKYGFEYDHMISDAAGKTLQLTEVLRSLPDSEDDEVGGTDGADSQISRQAGENVTTRGPKKERAPFFTFELFAVNKWLLFATIIVVTVSGVLYFWANQPSQETSSAESAQDVNLDGTPLQEYVKTGRATSETLYAIALPAWEQLSEEKKRELLQQALVFANINGQKNVQFVNVRGRSVAFANKKRVEIFEP